MQEQKQDLQEQAGSTKKPRPEPLTEAQRLEIFHAWRGGTSSITKLAQQYGRSVGTIHALVSRMDKAAGGMGKKVENQKTSVVETVAAATAAAVAAASSDASLTAQRIAETKNETYRLQELIRKLVGKLIVEARQKNAPLSTIHGDLRSLKEAAATLKISREEAYAVLGLNVEGSDDDDVLPELKIQDLTQEEISSLRDASNTEDDLFGGDYEIPEVGGGVRDDEEES